MGAGLGGERDDEQYEAERGHAHADPLAHADLEAEDALGEDREHHDAGGEHGLDDRERGEGESRDVEQPGAGGDAHADREPLGGEQGPDGLQRMPNVDLGGAQAPRCLYRKPSCVATAQASASRMPSSKVTLKSRPQ